MPARTLRHRPASGFVAHAALCLLALVGLTPVVAQEIELEVAYRPNSPVRDPLSAWRAALETLEPGTRVRRLAFADHVLFVFHSAPGEDGILARSLTPIAEGFHVDADDERDPSLCKADGVAVERVEHALRRLLDSAEWKRHAARMDSLVLECMAAQLEWRLTQVPEGGFREGVPIASMTHPFEPGPEAPAPALER